MFSGHSWDVIRTNTYLLTHFMFIAQFARCIIGYNMTSLNKKEFVEEFRNCQAGAKKIIIAVGDGLNDMGMLQAASVGI